MAVHIQRQNHGAVAEAFLNNLWVYACGEKKRSGCMPEIVEPNSVEAGSFAQRPPEPASEIVLSDRSAFGICEHPGFRVRRDLEPLSVRSNRVNRELR
jgi:hypothetical protein